MTYLSNVQAMCDRLGLPNPVREEDINIDKIIFYQSNKKFNMIRGDEMNKAGRLFFQEKFSNPRFQVNFVDITAVFKREAADHFAERWEDAEEKGRFLIRALKNARSIEFKWKQGPYGF